MYTHPSTIIDPERDTAIYQVDGVYKNQTCQDSLFLRINHLSYKSSLEVYKARKPL